MFTPEGLVERMNFDLANDLGNLVHRTAAMLHRFAGGRVPAPGPAAAGEAELAELAAAVVDEMAAAMDDLQFSVALAAVWKLVGRANKYIDETAPWALHKNGEFARLHTVMYTLCEVIRVIAVLISPFLPRTAARIFAQYGVAPELQTWESLRPFGRAAAGTPVATGEPLFPRLDVAAEIAALDALTSQRAGAGAAGAGTAGGNGNGLGDAVAGAAGRRDAAVPPADSAAGSAAAGKPIIGIEQFDQVEMRVAQVVAAERIPGADKLLRLEVDLGGERRQIVSGIAQHYAPEALLGRKVVVVTNLKPAKLRGVMSYGMVLAASAGDRLQLVTVPDDMPNGAEVR